MIEKNQGIEDIVFKELIQSNVTFYTEKGGVRNVIKVGNIKNFNIKLPFLFFILEIKNKLREFPLPQPFDYTWEKNRLRLSYKIENCSTDKNVVDKMVDLGLNTDSKLFNQILYIEINNE